MSALMTVTALLVLAAFICTIASAMGHAPLWVSVMLLCLIEMLRIWPAR